MKRQEIYTAPKPEFILLGSRFIDNIEKTIFLDNSEYLLIKKFIDYVKEAEIDLKIVNPRIRSFQLDCKPINVDEIIGMF